MGGLVVLLAAIRSRPHSIVLLEPSPPGEVQGFDPSVSPAPGTFDPEEAYGPFPAGYRARPESSFARAERKRGISVPSLPCPLLVICGDEFRAERGEAVARVYGSNVAYLPGRNHWDLVLDPGVLQHVAQFLGVETVAGPG
jgi:hypothetical protein